MSVRPESEWPLGAYSLDFFDDSMIHAVRSARRVAVNARRGVTGADWLALARDVVIAELKALFQNLPKGVSFRLPGDNSSDGALFKTQFYVAANPLDAGNTRFDPVLGACATIAVQSAERVIAAYAVDILTGFLHCVRPNESTISMQGPTGESLEREFKGDALANRGVIDKKSLLFDGDIEGVGHEELNRLLTAHAVKLLERRRSAERSSVLGLLEVIEGRAAAYVRQAGEETAPWVDLPIIGFGRAGGIRVFSIEEDYLQETTLAPRVCFIGEDDDMTIGRAPAAEDGITIRDHGLLYVRRDRAAELLRHLPVRPLLSGTK